MPGSFPRLFVQCLYYLFGCFLEGEPADVHVQTAFPEPFQECRPCRKIQSYILKLAASFAVDVLGGAFHYDGAAVHYDDLVRVLGYVVHVVRYEWARPE